MLCLVLDCRDSPLTCFYMFIVLHLRLWLQWRYILREVWGWGEIPLLQFYPLGIWFCCGLPLTCLTKVKESDETSLRRGLRVPGCPERWLWHCSPLFAFLCSLAPRGVLSPHHTLLPVCCFYADPKQWDQDCRMESPELWARVTLVPLQVDRIQCLI